MVVDVGVKWDFVIEEGGNCGVCFVSGMEVFGKRVA